MGINDAKDIRKSLKPLDSQLVLALDNLVDQVWGKTRPARAASPISIHPLKYAGESTCDKIKKLRKEFKERKGTGIVVSALDDVACKSLILSCVFELTSLALGLLNIRGTDIDYNPVAFGVVLVTESIVMFFVQETALSDQSRKYFKENDIEIEQYSKCVQSLKKFGSGLRDTDKVSNLTFR